LARIGKAPIANDPDADPARTQSPAIAVERHG
jgi:hypothetical protein